MSVIDDIKKYELIDSDIYGLYRVKALRDFGDVKAGDIGGYVDDGHNLSHDGDCWIYANATVTGTAAVLDDAQVFGDATVYDNAFIYGDARVSGEAKVSGKVLVYGDAVISGKAEVYGDAKVYGYAIISGNARVYGDAEVSGNAQVYGDARVYGNAKVYENAQVFEGALVYGNAKVFGFASVYEYAEVFGNAQVCGDTEVSRKDKLSGDGEIKEAAMKNDKTDRKSAIEFIHPDTILGMGNAMRAGEMKYAAWNFTKGHGRLQLCASTIRHITSIMRGDLIDKDTTERLGQTVYHWDCVLANINMMIYQYKLGTLKDDGPISEHIQEDKKETLYEVTDDVSVVHKHDYTQVWSSGPAETKR